VIPPAHPRFVIITPAFNEEPYLEVTIPSVTSQTRVPLRWIIVDDGSTDHTREKVMQVAQAFPWVVYHRRHRQPGQAYFASNVYAIMEGVDLAKDLDYEFPRSWTPILLSPTITTNRFSPASKRIRNWASRRECTRT